MQYTEQRRFERYLPPEGAIAAFKPFEEFGLINDISKGGLSFEYLAFVDSSDVVPEIRPHRQIDIFIPGANSRPMTFQCKVVRVAERLLGSYAHSVVPKKRCCVEFMGFKKETMAALNAFLVQCRKCKPLFGENPGVEQYDLQ